VPFAGRPVPVICQLSFVSTLAVGVTRLQLMVTASEPNKPTL